MQERENQLISVREQQESEANCSRFTTVETYFTAKRFCSGVSCSDFLHIPEKKAGSYHRKCLFLAYRFITLIGHWKRTGRIKINHWLNSISVPAQWVPRHRLWAFWVWTCVCLCTSLPLSHHHGAGRPVWWSSELLSSEAWAEKAGTSHMCCLIQQKTRCWSQKRNVF